MSTNPVVLPRRKVVVAPKLGAGGFLFLLRLAIVWMSSAVLHAAMIAGFLFLLHFVGLGTAPASDTNAESAVTTQLDDDTHDADPTNIDPGFDPTRSLNFDVPRIEDVSIPGIVDPTSDAGVPGDSQGLRQSLPAPPGVGSTGLGAGKASLDTGPGALFGPAGGYPGGLTVPASFGYRMSGSTRARMVDQNGGNLESEACVARGLKWLAMHQAPDGHWGLNDFQRYAHAEPSPSSKTFVCTCTGQTGRQNDIAATAFALLPFLAAGQTHKASKDTQQIDYSKTVKAGLDYLMTKQGADGYFGGDAYAHGIASIALCEAFGMTSDPTLKTHAQKAIRYIEAAQDPVGGGWRYSPRTPGDTSVTGWQVMALKSGQISGLELANKGEVLKKAEMFLNSVESANRGGYSYLPNSGETVVMTAVGMLCRQYLGVAPRNPGLLAGVDRIKAMPPGKSGNIYYEYYATQVMHHMGGDAWDFWNEGPGGKNSHAGIRDTLIAKQDTTLARAGSFPGQTPPLPLKLAHQDGSWGPDAAGGLSDGGRIMWTSLSLLTLEVYYRHLPLYRKDMGVNKDMEQK